MKARAVFTVYWVLVVGGLLYFIVLGVLAR